MPLRQRISSEQSRNQVICHNSSIHRMCSLIMPAVRRKMRLKRLIDTGEWYRMILETCAVASIKISNRNSMMCRIVMFAKTSSTPERIHNKHLKYKIDSSSLSHGVKPETLPPKSSTNHLKAGIQNMAGLTDSINMNSKRRGLHTDTPIQHNKEGNKKVRVKTELKNMTSTIKEVNIQKQ